MNNETTIALRYILANLYPTIDDSRRVVSDAGIPAMQITFNAKAINNWYEILREASHRNKILDIVKVVLEDFPDNPTLTQIIDNGELSLIPAPSIDTDLGWRGNTSEDNLEKIIGKENTLLPISFLEAGLQRSRSVARVRLADGKLGTGFLTENNIFVTNHHVFKNTEQAEKAIIQFNYQKSIEGLDLESSDFKLSPEEIFVTSKEDDWTFVKVQGDANSIWGEIKLTKIEDYKQMKYVNIIQHPGGGSKQIALYHNIVVYADEKRIQYLTDTLPGSSGSPVFDDKWRIIALHHSGGWLIEPGTKDKFFRNEGININLVEEVINRS